MRHRATKYISRETYIVKCIHRETNTKNTHLYTHIAINILKSIWSFLNNKITCCRARSMVSEERCLKLLSSYDFHVHSCDWTVNWEFERVHAPFPVNHYPVKWSDYVRPLINGINQGRIDVWLNSPPSFRLTAITRLCQGFTNRPITPLSLCLVSSEKKYWDINLVKWSLLILSLS